jgi:hypothetical protein
MKSICLTIILTVLLTFTTTGISISADTDQPPKIMVPDSISGPHTITMEEWTNIIRSLPKTAGHPKAMPDKPFRFRKEQKNRIVL